MKNRHFYFNGKKKTCLYHLRIGVNCTEQHMIRIYFTIEDGKVLIGDVNKHLPSAVEL